VTVPSNPSHVSLQIIRKVSANYRHILTNHRDRAYVTGSLVTEADSSVPMALTWNKEITLSVHKLLTYGNSIIWQVIKRRHRARILLRSLRGKKSKVVPVLNYLSITPRRLIGEWRYSSSILDLANR
jgi:hypothetical protein